jgi:hypothetical protein
MTPRAHRITLWAVAASWLVVAALTLIMDMQALV